MHLVAYQLTELLHFLCSQSCVGKLVVALMSPVFMHVICQDISFIKYLHIT